MGAWVLGAGWVLCGVLALRRARGQRTPHARVYTRSVLEAWCLGQALD